MRHVLICVLCAGPALAADDPPAPTAPPAVERRATPLADALGRAIDPPVCCQLFGACSPGSAGAAPAEVRSLCLAANGQPLTGQFCHADRQCRP